MSLTFVTGSSDWLNAGLSSAALGQHCAQDWKVLLLLLLVDSEYNRKEEKIGELKNVSVFGGHVIALLTLKANWFGVP